MKGVTRSERHPTCRNALREVEPDSTCRATCDFKKSFARGVLHAINYCATCNNFLSGHQLHEKSYRVNTGLRDQSHCGSFCPALSKMSPDPLYGKMERLRRLIGEKTDLHAEML